MNAPMPRMKSAFRKRLSAVGIGASLKRFETREKSVQCLWDESVPYADIVNVGSCRQPVTLTRNFAFQRFNHLCTDNSTDAAEQGLTVVLDLNAKPKPKGPALDPAAQELAKLAEEQRVADAASQMVADVGGGSAAPEAEESPEAAEAPFQPEKTLFLPHAVDYNAPFQLRLRIKGHRPQSEMRAQRVKLVHEGQPCSGEAAMEVQGMFASSEPGDVAAKEVRWAGVSIAPSPGSAAHEAAVYDVCYCAAEIGASDCTDSSRFARLRGKLVAGELTASPCHAWGYEVLGFKQVPALKSAGNIQRCVYDPRLPSANLVMQHCRKVMAFFPENYDVEYWGSDKSCAVHGRSIAKKLSKGF